MQDLPKTFGGFDGREEECLNFIRSKAVANNPASVLAAIDEFAYQTKWMMNVGDVKGDLLQKSLLAARPALVLELGTYIGYSALKMEQVLPPHGHIITLELSKKIAPIAREVIAFAGKSHRITVLNGKLEDADTLKQLEGRIGRHTVDFVFLDHFKEAYLPDLKLLLNRQFLHEGSVAFADNVLFPGAPDYLKFMKETDVFTTTYMETLLEYQSSVKDLVLESILQKTSASSKL